MFRNSITFFKKDISKFLTPIVIKRTHFAPPLDVSKVAPKRERVDIDLPDLSEYQWDRKTDLLFKHTVKKSEKQDDNSSRPKP